ncbi:MAG: hypothetical protein EP298_11400 [Gammaproteobacteria bacterium]|nr:MAG: hypothetical protein EP298_11400 [Gammaproteobacteria bacterium]UTW43223.1 hypothetical protein KFE69_03505 [bacterium SCSIO 12844]
MAGIISTTIYNSLVLIIGFLTIWLGYKLLKSTNHMTKYFHFKWKCLQITFSNVSTGLLFSIAGLALIITSICKDKEITQINTNKTQNSSTNEELHEKIDVRFLLPK